jgi:hypothetical protein
MEAKICTSGGDKKVLQIAGPIEVEYNLNNSEEISWLK